MELSSKSDQEWLQTELSTITGNTLDQINIEFSLDNISQEKEDNGGHSIQEPIPSEPGLEETMLSQTTTEDNLESCKTLSLDHGEMSTTKRFHTIQEMSETSEIQLDIALMFTMEETEMTRKSSTGHATMVQTKHGSLIEDHFTSQDIH
jgi:hypothetical protein